MARRALSAALATAAVAAGLTFGSSASADTGVTTVAPQVTWAYTDIASPKQTFIDKSGDAPVGAWLGSNGKYHVSRSYFTYDISAYRRGMTVMSATFYSREQKVTDCERSVPVELWLTDDITSDTSWLKAPTARKLIRASDMGKPGACPNAYETALVAVLQEAVDAGKTRLTLSLRVAGNKELDPRLGRWFLAGNTLSVGVNTPPPIPTGLSPCGSEQDAPYLRGPVAFRGTSVDADQDATEDPTVAVWPVADPAQRQEISTVSRPSDGLLELSWDHDGAADGLYAWTMKNHDGDHESGWSATCYFQLDHLPPATPSSVSSVDYPADGQLHGGQGVPGTFTIVPSGSDAVKYQWVLNNAFGQVPAGLPGEPVNLVLTPMDSATNTLRVQAVDRAGNRSEEVVYEFRVRDTAPGVDIEVGGVDLPSRINMIPGVAGVVEYGYRIGDGEEVRIPAEADGKASAQVVFHSTGHATVTVRSWTASGVTGVRVAGVNVSDEPRVASELGSGEATLVFKPGRLGVVTYEYTVDYDETVLTVTADADGLARIRLELAQDYHFVYVRSIGSDGVASSWAWHDFIIE